MLTAFCKWLCRNCVQHDKSHNNANQNSVLKPTARISDHSQPRIDAVVHKERDGVPVRDATSKSSTDRAGNSQQKVHTINLPENFSQIVVLLRKDDVLCKRFVLDMAGNDLDSLIQAVAILSQEANLKRLWEMYHKRCEDRQKPASADEIFILKVVLGWHNYNWPNKPYHLSEPSVGDAYDYNEQLRGGIHMNGEKVIALWLPGIPNLKLKPVVDIR